MTFHASDRESTDAGPGACLVCGGALAADRIRGLLRCVDCGFVTADLRLEPEALEALYAESYFTGEEYVDYLAEEESLKANFRRRLAHLERRVERPGTARLFEIGCAYGFFLDLAAESFGTVAGIDLSSAAVTHARRRHGDRVHCGDYLALALPEPCDVIVLWDTIEHLDDPRAFLQKVARDLAPGGTVALTTGDIGSLNARLRGARWRMIHPPTHLHYFSGETMTRLLHDVGFESIEISHPGTTRTLRAYASALLPAMVRESSAGRRAMASRVLDRGASINLGDIMLAVARRPGAER